MGWLDRRRSRRSEPEVSEGGSQIHRHERSARPKRATGDGQLIEAIGAHIERHIGDPANVFHQLVSPYVHVDIHMVSPTEERPYTTLVTTGMSERPMKAPDAEYSRAELVLALPPDWPLDGEAFREERHYWPFRLLQMLAAFPHEYDTWLWMGHTIPNGDPPAAYADDTGLCCALLFPPLLTPPEFDRLETGGETITFLGVYPLYEDEMRLKLEAGADALADRFEAAGVTEALDRQRPSVA